MELFNECFAISGLLKELLSNCHKEKVHHRRIAVCARARRRIEHRRQIRKYFASHFGKVAALGGEHESRVADDKTAQRARADTC